MVRLRSLSLMVGLSAVAAALLKLRVLPDLRAHRATKSMDTDNHGNYDLDGVSYDPRTYSVIVTGDGQAPSPVAEVLIVGEVVSLHAPEEPRKRNVSA